MFLAFVQFTKVGNWHIEEIFIAIIIGIFREIAQYAGNLYTKLLVNARSFCASFGSVAMTY
jgi:hypothetical protein